MLREQQAEADRLILQAATGARRLTRDELRRVLEHVAQAGFHPTDLARAKGRLAGFAWQGRVLKGSDLLSTAESHYIWHVWRNQEWPQSPRPPSLQEYIDSVRRVVLDPASGVFTNRYQGAWSLEPVMN